MSDQSREGKTEMTDKEIRDVFKALKLPSDSESLRPRPQPQPAPVIPFPHHRRFATVEPELGRPGSPLGANWTTLLEELRRAGSAHDVIRREALAALVAHPAERAALGARAGAAAAGHSAWDEIARRTLALYEELV